MAYTLKKHSSKTGFQSFFSSVSMNDAIFKYILKVIHRMKYQCTKPAFRSFFIELLFRNVTIAPHVDICNKLPLN